MSSSLRVSAVAVLVLFLAPPAGAAELAVRFHPAERVWAYPLDSARSINGVLVQNTALVNESAAPVTVSAVELQVLSDGAVVASVRLDAGTLDEIAGKGRALAESGMLKALDFQFAPGELLGEAPQVSASRTLAPRAALLLPHQFLSFKGDAERLRVTARLAGAGAAPTGELAIRHGAAGTFRFPLEGRWFVGAGATPHSHHRWAVPEEFGLDLVRIGAGSKTYRADGTRVQDYYAYGAGVLAVGPGEVVRVHDGAPDNVGMLRRPSEALADYQRRLLAGQAELLAADVEAIAGNYVIIRHAAGIYGVYAHLKPRSLKVVVGDKVETGQQIATVGGSGNSTEPHLHFHLCDAPRTLHCSGLLVAFDNVELPWSDAPRVLQSGDLVLTRQPARPRFQASCRLLAAFLPRSSTTS